MPDLQYVIDTICARFTDKSIYEMIQARFKQGSLLIGDITPLIQAKDRSLDLDSAKRLAEVALQDMVRWGDVRTDGNRFFPMK